MPIPKCNFPGILRQAIQKKSEKVMRLFPFHGSQRILHVSLFLCVCMWMENIITYSNHDFKKTHCSLDKGHNKSFFDKIPKKFCFLWRKEGVNLSCMRQTDILAFSKTISELFIHIVVTNFLCYFQWICIFYNILWSSFTNWKHCLYKLPNYQTDLD